ncbi:hypothetical protein GQ465_08345 [Salmonella enterica subsp. enterica serovar Typhi]|nr:hypothetical protein [Salmonella enterica subsp. enterica serovar Typhi]
MNVAGDGPPGAATKIPGADLNVACDGPSGRGPWMGRVIRSQHISNLKYEGYISGSISCLIYY